MTIQYANENQEQVFSISENSGMVTIVGAESDDSIMFENFDENYELLNYGKSGNDLIITRNKNSKVVLKDYFIQDPNKVLDNVNELSIKECALISIMGKGKINGTILDDEIYGSAGNDTIFASNGGDDVIAGKGNDVIYTSKEGSWVAGGRGNDKIYIKERTGDFENVISYCYGDGSDYIYNATSKDEIDFNQIDKNDVIYNKVGDDLVLSLLPKKSKMITLVDYFKSADKLDTVRFFDFEAMLQDTVSIKEQIINLNGTSKNDTLYAPTDFDCIINSSKGNDTLYLTDGGIKTVKISEGQGNLDILMDDNSEKVVIELTSKKPELSFVEYGKDVFTGSDLIIYHYGLNTKIDDFYITNKITIKNYFSVELTGDNLELKLNDESTITLNGDYFKDYKFRLLANGSTLNGTEDDDFIRAGDKDVDIYAHEGNDVIDTGLKGEKDIESGAGDDEIYITNLKSSEIFIHDLAGNDTITINGLSKDSSACFFFDIGKDANSVLGSPNLFILKSTDILGFIKGKLTTGVVEIADYFSDKKYENEDGNMVTSGGGGEIETFFLKDRDRIEINAFVERVEREIADWFEQEGHQHYSCVSEVLKGKSSKHKKEIINIYTKESPKVVLDFESDIHFEGSKYNDYIEVASNCTLNSGSGNDKILRGQKDNNIDTIYASNYELNGGNGNDVLEAGANTFINGGTGENVIKISENSSVVIAQGKGKDYIHFTDGNINDVNLEKTGNDLIIILGSARATISNYFKYLTKSCVKGIAFGDVIVDYENEFALDIVKKVKENAVNNTILDLLNDPTNKLSLVGTYSSDKLIGTKYSDLILAGEGKDTITAGLGSNVLEYGEQDGSDIINLTKGENFTLHLKDVHDKADIYYEIKDNKDVLVYTGNGEFATFNGLGKKDITNNATRKSADKSSVLVQYEDTLGETHYIDLRKDVTYGIEVSKNYTGTWLNDEIHGCLDEPGKNDLGLTLKGGNGNDVIWGTTYNDKLYGDNGNDSITGGSGKDTIYSGAGNDTIKGASDNDVINLGTGETTLVFSNGDGHDTIYMSTKDKIEDKLQFMDTTYSDIKFEVKGNDMILWHEGDGNGGYLSSVTIKNWVKYYNPDKNKVPMLNKIYNAFGENWAQEDIVSLCKNDIDNNVVTKKTINGSKMIDIIHTKSEFNEIVKAGAGDDTIYGTSDSGKDTVYGGTGDDKIFYETSIDSVYLDGEAGNDSLTIYAGTAIGGLGDDTIRVAGFSNGTLIYGDLTTKKDKKQTKGGNDTIYGGYGGRDNQQQLGGDTIYAGGGDDEIYGNGGCDVIYGGSGNDKIFSYRDEITKNYTEDVVVKMYGGDGNDTIYATSETNYIYGDKGNDVFYAYIDQYTEIADSSGVDELNLIDANHSDLTLRFNISRKYKTGGAIKDIKITDEYETNGVCIKTNSVETIKTSDGYMITSAQIQLMAQEVVAWLKNTNYIDVNDAFENCGNIEYEQLSAIFSKEGNWSQI